jgi:5,10-methylenetetrahydromethanopterin reductase
MADGMAERQRIGVALRDPLPWRDLAMIVETAEETGFDVAFFPEIPGGRDTLATISGLAANTSLLLGSGVVALPSRRLSLLAMAAATAHERTGGRLILGLGSGLPGPGSLDRVRAAVAFLRDAFAGNAVDEAGMPFTLNLDLGSAPPIWVAALGDRMVALAGEVADGVLLNWCPPERVHRAAATVADAAARADRDPPEIGVYVRAAWERRSPSPSTRWAPWRASTPACRTTAGSWRRVGSADRPGRPRMPWQRAAPVERSSCVPCAWSATPIGPSGA